MIRDSALQSWGAWALLGVYVWVSVHHGDVVVAGGLALGAILLAMNGLGRTRLWLPVTDEHWWRTHPRLHWLHHTFDEGELAGIAIALVCAAMMLERGDEVMPSGLRAFVAGPLTLFGVLSAANLASADMRQLLARLERAVGLFWTIVLGSTLASFASVGAAVFVGDYFAARTTTDDRPAVATGLAATIGSGMGLTPFAAPPVLIVWPLLQAQVGWSLGTLVVLVGIGALLHVALSAMRFKDLIGPTPPQTTMAGWPRTALLLLVVVLANIVAAGTPAVLVADVLIGLYAMRRGADYATRWQPLVLAVLLAGLDLVGRESDPFIQSLAAHLPESAPTVLLACILWYATAFTSHFADNALASRIFIGVAFTIGAHDGRSPEEADLLAASVVLGAMWGGFALIPANLPNFRLAKVFEVSPGEWGRAALSRLYLSTGWIQPLWIVAVFLFWKHY
ncbi:MAG: hypothetical protein EBZ40_05740 [Gammaproteobacteria bacterium]|jgi:hypothetical protein|nr:hypothetical protein [Gammaproteobacteria bacterium]